MPSGANYSPRESFVAQLDRKPLSLLDNLVCLLNPATILPRPARLPTPKTRGWTRCSSVSTRARCARSRA